MLVNREKFIKALFVAYDGAASQESFDGADCFRFSAGYVETRREGVAWRVPISTDCTDGEIRGNVSAKDLFALLNTFKSETFDLELTDAGIYIRCGKARISLASIRIDDAEMNFPSEFVPLEKDITDALRGVAMLDAKADYVKDITGVFVANKIAYATDGKRLRYAPCALPIGDVYLPNALVERVQKNDFVGIAHDDLRVYLSMSDGSIFTARKKSEAPPNGASIVERFSAPAEFACIFPSETGDILNRAILFAEKKQEGSYVTLTFAPLEVTISCGRSRANFFESAEWAIPYEHDEPVRKVRVNAQHFRKMVSESQTMSFIFAQTGTVVSYKADGVNVLSTTAYVEDEE